MGDSKLNSLIREAMPFVKPTDEYIDKLVELFSTDPNRFLYYNDHGFIAGILTDQYILLPDTKIAIEVAWWVAPEYRGKNIGKELYKEFEEWAKLNDAQAIIVGRQINDSEEISRTYLKWVQK